MVQKKDEKGNEGSGSSTVKATPPPAINEDTITAVTGVALPLSEIPLEIENGEDEEIARDCRLSSGSEPRRQQQQQQEMMSATQLQKESMVWTKVIVVVVIVLVLSIGLTTRNNGTGSTQNRQPRLPEPWVINSCYEECYEYWYNYPDGTTTDIIYGECCEFWEDYYRHNSDNYYGDDYYDQDYRGDLEPYNLAAANCNVPPYTQIGDPAPCRDVVPGHPNSFWYNDLFLCRFSNRPCDVGINDGEYEVMNLGPDLPTIKIPLTGDVQAGEVWMVATDPNGQPVAVTRDEHSFCVHRFYTEGGSWNSVDEYSPDYTPDWNVYLFNSLTCCDPEEYEDVWIFIVIDGVLVDSCPKYLSQNCRRC